MTTPKSEWVPDPASVDLEEKMEAQDLPESDRDEIRRFAEVLRRKRDRAQGKELPPMPQEMKD